MRPSPAAPAICAASPDRSLPSDSRAMSSGNAAPVAFATATARAAVRPIRAAPGATSQKAVSKLRSWPTGLIDPIRVRPSRHPSRMRSDSSGCSLRMFEPRSRTDVLVPNSRIATSLAGNRGAMSSSRKSHCWRRWSTLSLPRARISFCSRWNSSSVEAGDASPPIRAASPWSMMDLRPAAQCIRAVSQSTACHAPPCRTIGRVSRLSELIAW